MRWNKLNTVGCLLTGVGFILLPFLIGIPILSIGCALLAVGAIISVAEMIPGGKKIVDECKAMFSRMFSWLKIVIHDSLK